MSDCKDLQRAEEQAQEIARTVTALQREFERTQSEAHVGQSVADQLAAEVVGIEQEIAATLSAWPSRSALNETPPN